jgi:hypothetical protein
MKAVLFVVYYGEVKDEIHIDRKWRPRIQAYTDNTCAIVGKNPRLEEKIFARFGITHSVVCKGEVYLKEEKCSHEKIMYF